MFAKQRWHSTWHLSPGCLLPPSWEGCWSEGQPGAVEVACLHPPYKDWGTYEPSNLCSRVTSPSPNASPCNSPTKPPTRQEGDALPAQRLRPLCDPHAVWGGRGGDPARPQIGAQDRWEGGRLEAAAAWVEKEAIPVMDTPGAPGRRVVGALSPGPSLDVRAWPRALLPSQVPHTTTPRPGDSFWGASGPDPSSAWVGRAGTSAPAPCGGAAGHSSRGPADHARCDAEMDREPSETCKGREKTGSKGGSGRRGKERQETVVRQQVPRPWGKPGGGGRGAPPGVGGWGPSGRKP